MRKEYNKIVRDKMIDIYKHDVENHISCSDYKIRYCEKDETLTLLKAKLAEEVGELIAVYDETDKTRLKEEIADVIEVLDAILYHNDLSFAEVLQLRSAKKEKRGGFERGLYLEYIDYL